MKQNTKTGPWMTWGIAALVIPLWWWTFPETTIRHSNKPFFVYTSQIAATVGFALFAISFILSTRIKWLEDRFGGLDKIYHMHHTVGKTAVVLMLIHPIMLALRWLPENVEKTLWYLLPVHRRLEINLGSWALWGIFLLMLITLVIKIPYDKWKIAHKFLGVFFFLSILHIFLLTEFISENTPLTIYLGMLSLLGMLAILYKSVFYAWFVDKHRFYVKEVKRLNSQVIEVLLASNNSTLRFEPGQFCFFSFKDKSISKEAHPYTICSTPEEKEITVIVKALGDYTRRFYEGLIPGTEATLEGPYGRFDYRTTSNSQIWIGGGVGIAPFISWARDLNQNHTPTIEAELYYCVNSEQELIHMEEFNALEEKLPGFHVHAVCADKEGFLKVQEIPGITEKSIFICGPKAMRKALLKDLKILNVSVDNIDYEDFDFP